MSVSTVAGVAASEPMPTDLLDLERYAWHDRAARDAIVARGRAELASEGCAVLPGFVTPAAIDRMVADATRARARAHRRDIMLGAYGGEPDAALPADHPRRRRSPYKMWVGATDTLPPDGAIRTLYGWDGLTRLVADLLQEPALYRVADPLLSCTVTYLAEGDQHGWHYDGNDFVVSLLLQAPERGGAFEFAPNLRSKDQENYDDVSAVLDERSPLTRRKAVTAGTLMLFCGQRALHRVSPVEGHRERIIALFSYDRAPDMHYPRQTHLNAIGRTDVIA